ncbi:MAG: sulfatase-like hydrolase/transferase [Rikenellaceae bacterium]|nr:sulfatase-like hydrolase/transferase [Rikenellaceae bacterium]
MKRLITIPLLSAAVFAQAENKRPNVLFILTDDLQYDAVQALGGQGTITPNMDSLVRSGRLYTNAYVNGGITGAISMPSRAMLLTGRTLFEINRDGMSIPDRHTTMPEHFRNNGYVTFGTGKWHSDKESFNRSFCGGENIFFGGTHRYELGGHVTPRLHHFDPGGSYQTTAFTADGFSSQLYADAALDFLSGAADSREPFFAYVAFTSPHDPRNVLPDYGYKFRWDMVDLPASFLPAPAFDNGDLTVRDELMVPAPRTREDVRRELAHYYGMVSEVDVQIGRLVRQIRQAGLWDDTVIVLASDNGLAVGRHGLLGKQNLYQHSVRVPLVVAGGAIEKGTSDALCYLPDIFPTLCNIAGLDIPASVTAVALPGGSEGGRDRLLLAYSSVQRAIIKDGFKLILYNVGGELTCELFDLTADPLEMHDLSCIAEYRGITEELRSELAAEMERSGDFCRLDTPFWYGKPEKISFEEGTSLFVYE